MKNMRKHMSLDQRRSVFLIPIILACTLIILLQSRWINVNKKRFVTEPATQRIECDYCNGTGKVPDQTAGTTFCPMCFGLGAHSVRPIDGYDNICPACGGMGRLKDHDTGEIRFCKRCGGRGLIRTEPEK